MRSLLKSDFYTIFKNKAVLINLFIYLGINLLTAVLYIIIKYAVPQMDGFVDFSFSSMYSTFFSFGDSIYVLLILVLTLNTRDFVLGTVRNKVLAGYSREKVYFSKYISILATALVVFFIGFLLSMTIYMSFFGVGSIEASQVVAISATGFLHIAFAITFAFFVSIATRNFGASIGIVLGVLIVFTFASSFLIVFTNTVLDGNYLLDPNSPLIWILKVIPFFQSGYFSGSVVGGGVPLTTTDYVLFTTTTFSFIILFINLGYLSFKRADLK